VLADEGLRMADHAGVPRSPSDPTSGRSSSFFVRWTNEAPPRSRASAEVFAVDVNRITTAVSYYGDYRDEIDGEIAAADEASIRAEQAWRACSAYEGLFSYGSVSAAFEPCCAATVHSPLA
jgi:hypothetical protein